jgi:hypothetical protein
MMTYQAIKRDFPVNAAAVFGAFTDLEALLAANPDAYPPSMLKQFWPDFDTRKDEKARSAIYWPEQLDVPLLDHARRSGLEREPISRSGSTTTKIR